MIEDDCLKLDLLPFLICCSAAGLHHIAEDRLVVTKQEVFCQGCSVHVLWFMPCPLDAGPCSADVAVRGPAYAWLPVKRTLRRNGVNESIERSRMPVADFTDDPGHRAFTRALDYQVLRRIGQGAFGEVS